MIVPGSFHTTTTTTTTLLVCQFLSEVAIQEMWLGTCARRACTRGNLARVHNWIHRRPRQIQAIATPHARHEDDEMKSGTSKTFLVVFHIMWDARLATGSTPPHIPCDRLR